MSEKKNKYGLPESDEHRTDTVEDLKALKEFILHLRSTFKSEREADKLRMDRDFETRNVTGTLISEERKAAFSYFPHINKFYGALPRRINYSCLLQIYTLFEERGRQLCYELKKRDKRIKISLDDITRQADYRSIRLFLDKIADVNYKHWSDLKLFSELRHRIVHRDGYTSDEDLMKRIEKTRGLGLEGNSNNTDALILIGDKYVDFILDRVTSLFDTVFQQKKFVPPSTFSSYISGNVSIKTETIDDKTHVAIYGWDEPNKGADTIAKILSRNR